MSYSQTVDDCLSQFPSHSHPSAAVHQRRLSGHHAWSRPNVDPDGRSPAVLESVLVATPREFESRILRQSSPLYARPVRP